MYLMGFPQRKGILVTYRKNAVSIVQKRLNRSSCRRDDEWDGPKKSCIRWSANTVELFCATGQYGCIYLLTAFTQCHVIMTLWSHGYPR